jgi:hypothetical protein
MEYLVPRNHQQIELRLLPVAQEQIFADCGFQNPVNVPAGLHGHGRRMIHPLVFQPDPIQ